MNRKKNKKIIGAYISIPKCATKTILNMLDLGKNRDDHFSDNKNISIIYENHQRLKILEDNYDLKNKYIFTFVRNPYDRIKSWYYYHKKIEPYKSTTLNQWIKNGCKTHWKVQNKTNWEKENLSPLLQYNFIKGKTNLNFIGRIEKFEEDCKKIINDLNIIYEKNKLEKRFSYKNIILNHSEKKDNKDEIDNESKEIIYELFKEDFEYFNYEKL